MKKIRFWLNNARTVSLPQSVTPALAALCFAIACSTSKGVWNVTEGGFSVILSILALIGIICAHLSCNLFDDYFDYRNAGIEAREQLHRAGMRARIAKATYLAEGQATLKETRNAASAFGAIAIAIGIVILVLRGLPILYLALIGGVLGFFYSAKPLMLCYRGLGELVIGIIFGPLLMVGMSIACCGTIPPGMWLLSSAVGLLVINILYTHSIMDAAPDTSVGKKTLATLLHTPTKMLAASLCTNILPYVLIILGVVLKMLSPWVLLSFVTLPMAISLFRFMVLFVEENEKKLPPSHHKPAKWMGKMENWEEIEKAEIDWFMLRWYLARNTLSTFVLVAAVAAFF